MARSTDKAQEPSGKTTKSVKQLGKEQPRDMVYYAQKMQGQSGALPLMQQSLALETDGQDGAIALDDTLPLEGSLILNSDGSDSLQDEAQQPTLSDILRQSYTVSVNGLKMQFGNLTEILSLLRHDIQKIRERTTAVEGRISEVEDVIPPSLGAPGVHYCNQHKPTPKLMISRIVSGEIMCV